MPTLIKFEDASDHQQVVSPTQPLPVTFVSGGGGFVTDVNLVTIGGVASSVNNGTADNGTLRVTIASDSTGQITALQGTSPWVVSGTVAATQSGTWNIATVTTVTSITNAVTVTGTVAISGTVAVTQSTSPWVVSGTVSSKTALTASSPTAATVGTSSAQAVAANASRKGLVLINTSNNTISLGLGATAVLLSGITLSGGGGTWVMDEFTFSTAAINAIASAISSNLAIQELT